MKFENTIMSSISNIISISKYSGNNVELSPEEIDFIESAEGFGLEILMGDYFGNHDTELGMDEIANLELGREYDAAEIYCMFHKEVKLNDLYEIIRSANYLKIDAVKKVHEDDDIVVILVSNLSWDSIYIRRDFDKYEVSNHYYVVNKRGE